jgi:cytochrome c-type biogenesis protein CcsB
MHRRIALLLLALILAVGSGTAFAADALDYGVMRSIPIQSNGRVKPFDTFARESVFTITGKEHFQGHDPIELLLSWLSDPNAARQAKIVDISNLDVRAAAGLSKTERWYSLMELGENHTFVDMLTKLQEKQQKQAELTSLDKQTQRVLGRIELLNSILNGEALAVVPNPDVPKGAWTSLAMLMTGTDATSIKLAGPQSEKLLGDVRDLFGAFTKKDNSAFVDASKRLKTDCAAVNPSAVPTDASIERELQYNDLHPFGKAWMIYLAALLVLIAAGAFPGKEGNPGVLYWGAFAMTLGGWILQLYGIFLRCEIAGRPPVTNMYESIIWVSFGAMFFAMVLEAIHRSRSLLLAANSVAIICLVLADNTATVLDPAINPLTPVLRSNFWLTIHVLTITLSYAAFMLSFGMGHIVLWNYAFHPKDRERIKNLHAQLYKAVQIGVLLLAAGTILGGVWANYSWGRFWGWDPKEVWALIALLGYLAVLHGRFAGWLKDFGMAVGAVCAFLGVLMAWYGVNFVLGAGLHSYGFGNGGQQYVAAAVCCDFALVWYLANRYQSFKNANRSRMANAAD